MNKWKRASKTEKQKAKGNNKSSIRSINKSAAKWEMEWGNRS